MVRIIFLLFFLSITLIGKSEELNNQEKIFFSFIFQLIDENRDEILNEEEIIELKYILESLS